MKFIQLLKKELAHIFPAFLFFLVMFNIVNLTERFLFEKADITPYTFVNIFIGAALVAKIILVIDHLPGVNLSKKIPQIYNIAWKTTIYSILTFFVRVAIQLTPYLFLSKDLKADYERFYETLNWPLFMTIQAWYMILLFIFITARELTEIIGLKKMKKIFFG